MAYRSLQPRPNRHRSARGFVFLDAMIGLATIVTLTVLLGLALGQQSRATRHLADTREAVRIAETTLQRLREAGPKDLLNLSLPQTPEVQITMTPLRPTRQGPVDWMQIKVVCRTGQATLVGPMVPDQGVALR